jgi:hypothetical protein
MAVVFISENFPFSFPPPFQKERDLADIANALRVPVWDIAAFAKALLGA